MLQAPSHLSRVCGHSHIKKFWLMQMQNESQACENKSSLVAPSSLPVSSSSAKSPENKQSPQRGSGSPGMRSLLAGATLNGRSACPLLGSAIIPAGCGSATRHTSIVTCAESLSPPVRSDQTHRSFRTPSPDFSAGKFKEEVDEGDYEEVYSDVSKSPSRERALSLSTSRIGSPSEDAEVDLIDISSHDSEHSKTITMGLPSGKAQAMNTANVQLPTASTTPCVRDNHCLLKSGPNADNRSYLCCNVYTSSVEGEDFSKDVDQSPDESHSSDSDNSDSGSDDGSFQYVSSPVRGGRARCPEKKVRLLDGKSPRNVWDFPAPPNVGQAIQAGGLLRENSLSGNLEASVEDANVMRNNVLRICSLCGTSKTPLWRSGPHGPKSLCNACGIRFKKSKRCPGQVDGCDQLVSPTASPIASKPPYRPLKRKQESFLPFEYPCPRDAGSEVISEPNFQLQKRSRWPKLLVKGEIGGHREDLTGSSESCLTLNLQSPSSLSSRKVRLNTQTLSELGKSADVEEHRTVGRVIAKDEEEAAVLLMYLSCGLVYA